MPESTAWVIRRPLLQGRQPVAALWFAHERFSEAQRQRMILEQWQPGASARRFADGDLLSFAQPQWRVCEQLEGWPLIRLGPVLCSAALDPQERQALPQADLWLVRGGQVQALQLASSRLLAPGSWLELGDYPLFDTFDCQMSLPSQLPEPEPLQSDIRQILGNCVAAPDPEREVVMRALAERQPRQSTTGKGRKFSMGQAVEALAAPGMQRWLLHGGLALLGLMLFFNLGHSLLKPRQIDAQAGPEDLLLWIASILLSAVLFTLFLAWLGRQLRVQPGVSDKGSEHSASKRTAQGLVQDQGGTPGNSAEGGARAAESAWQQAPAIKPRAQARRFKPSAWRKLLQRLAQGVVWQDLYGRRQAAYLQRMLDMFERGQLDQALRHAIPLMKDGMPSDPSFATPQPRKDLDLKRGESVLRNLALDDEIREHLRQVYRQTFNRLDREGRIEEAVFVLAELFNAHQEALDYLERHGRFEQAAGLALAWDSPASVIVRLLCLAGDWQQALHVARRDDAFADAVALLQERWPEQAEQLRLEWAHHLTRQGLWLQAVDVIWSLPAERERAAQWLLAAEAAGGRLAAAALVKRAILLPDTLDAYADYLTQLRDEPQRSAERAGLAEALLQHKSQSKPLAWLANALVHALLADAAQGVGQMQTAQLLSLVKLSQNKLLQQDLPARLLPRHRPVALAERSEPLEWRAGDAGARPILDAVPLDDGRYLLALGEAGAAVVDAQGRVLFNFAQPAWQIVLAHGRQVALVLARRDKVWRISKLDLVQRQATDLGTLVLQQFAREFDGVAWTIGLEQEVRVVDVDHGFRTLWHVGDVPGQVLQLQADAQNEWWWVGSESGDSECWHYLLPERRLRARDRLQVVAQNVDGLTPRRSLSVDGEVFSVWVKAPETAEPVLILELANNRQGWRLPGLGDDLYQSPRAQLSEQWLVAGYFTASGEQMWHFIHRPRAQLAASLIWPESCVVGVRCLGPDWLLFDQRGRLAHVDVNTGQLRNLSLY